MLFPLPFGLFDEVGETGEILGGELAGAGRVAEMGGEGFFQRAIKEDIEDTGEGRAGRTATGLGGTVEDVAAFLATEEVAFLFHDAKQRAQGAAHGRVGQFGKNLGDGGFAVGEDDIHDLAFALAELGWIGHEMLLMDKRLSEEKGERQG